MFVGHADLAVRGAHGIRGTRVAAGEAAEADARRGAEQRVDPAFETEAELAAAAFRPALAAQTPPLVAADAAAHEAAA